MDLYTTTEATIPAIESELRKRAMQLTVRYLAIGRWEAVLHDSTGGHGMSGQAYTLQGAILNALIAYDHFCTAEARI